MLAIGLILGAALGAFTAWRRKGNWLDMLQYAAGYGIAVGLLFFLASLIYVRVS